MLLNKQQNYLWMVIFLKPQLSHIQYENWTLHYFNVYKFSFCSIRDTQYINYLVPYRAGVECTRSVMVKAMDYEIVVSEFKLQLRYYAHYRTNPLGKSMNPLILLTMG